ncbi:MAG: hypothetical protein Q9223_001043 [Gallowayella weberi]
MRVLPSILISALLHLDTLISATVIPQRIPAKHKLQSYSVPSSLIQRDVHNNHNNNNFDIVDLSTDAYWSLQFSIWHNVAVTQLQTTMAASDLEMFYRAILAMAKVMWARGAAQRQRRAFVGGLTLTFWSLSPIPWEFLDTFLTTIPYREYSYNNSSAILAGLPDYIPLKHKPPINILKYPYEINCIYTELLSLAPQLWNGKRSVYEPDSASTKPLEIDLMIHIGMHPDDDVWFFEKRARREKYELPGDDGKFLPKEALKGQPERLSVGFDVDDIATRVRRSIPDDITVKTSNEAGLYFCELLSYLSLAILDERKEFGRVVFLHVPKLRGVESIERGIKVATALITECINSLPGDYQKTS